MWFLRFCNAASRPTSPYPYSRDLSITLQSFQNFDGTLTAIYRQAYGENSPTRNWSRFASSTPPPSSIERTVTALFSSRNRGTLTALAPMLSIVSRTPHPTIRATITPRPNLRATATPRLQGVPPVLPTQRRTPVPTTSPRSRPPTTSPEIPPPVWINIEDRINVDAVVTFTVQLSLIWITGMVVVSGLGALLNKALLSDLQRGRFASRPYPLSLPMRLIQPVYGLVTLAATGLMIVLLPLVALCILTLWLAINRNLVGAFLDVVAFLFTTVGFSLMLLTLKRLWSLFRFAKNPSGYYLFRHEAPTLWQFVEGVIPVDKIWLTSGSYCRLHPGRRLVLGMALLSEISQEEFKALLRHEAARLPFSLNNTAPVIAQIRDGLERCDDYLEKRGNDHLYDIAVWSIVKLFNSFYREITYAAVWLNTLLIDRHVAAVSSYSLLALDTIRQTILIQMKFDLQQEQHIRNALQQRRPIFNVYTPIPLSEAQMAAIHRKVNYLPTLQMRREILECWLPPSSGVQGNSQPVLALFEDGEAMQHLMTITLLQHVNPKLFESEVPKPSVYYRTR